MGQPPVVVVVQWRPDSAHVTRAGLPIRECASGRSEESGGSSEGGSAAVSH